MDSYQEFEHNLAEMLSHLYDPAYRPPESLWKALNLNRQSGIQALRDTILAGIEALRPAEQVPVSARAWRIFGMLYYRYTQDFSQEMTAEKLGITSRHLRRVFFEAIHALSLILAEKGGGELSGLSDDTNDPIPAEARNWEDKPSVFTAHTNPAVSWHEQLARELESLEETAAGAVSNVAETVDSVVRLAAHLTKQQGISLQAGPISPRLMVAIHPSVLRQVLISMITQLAKQMQAGEIRLSASPGDGRVQIGLSARPMSDPAFSNFEPIRELLSSFSIFAELDAAEGSIHCTLGLIQVDRCVLVVDDNTDMAHLYRRYLTGTRYYLQHVTRGEKTFDAIDLYHPDLVVLDVMLPDMDGWDLLTRLHENPFTRQLPVMICSVMREKELAQALGARYFLSKPVQRQAFLTALDTVLQVA